jgi:hypothetical protein
MRSQICKDIDGLQERIPASSITTTLPDTTTLPHHVYVSFRDDMELRQIRNKLKSDLRFAVPEGRWGSPQSCLVTDDIAMGHKL